MYAIIKYEDITESQIVGNSNQGITKELTDSIELI